MDTYEELAEGSTGHCMDGLQVMVGEKEGAKE